MKLCSCTRGIKRKRCLCKDFEGVVAKGGSIFVEAMYTCACDVGKMFNKCDNPLHIKALDYRAATYEMLHLLNRAAKDASWMLELAPRLPDVRPNWQPTALPLLTDSFPGLPSPGQGRPASRRRRVCPQHLRFRR